LLVAVALIGLAAPVAADDKEKAKETGPVVVDFSALVGTKGPTITLKVRLEDGRVWEEKVETTRTFKDLEVAADYVDSVALLLNPPYDVVAVKDKPELIIGHKDKGVLEVTCVAVGLPCENQPKVSRLKEKK
jgi:hypothetical protein